MDAERWLGLLSRIVPQDADDLDDLTSPYDQRHAVPGVDVFPDVPSVAQPQSLFKRADSVCVGVRIREPLQDAHDRAVLLASLALEQDLEVVVLAYTDRTGLERFGFRVERITGATPADEAVCEEQVRRFWAIDLVL